MGWPSCPLAQRLRPSEPRRALSPAKAVWELLSISPEGATEPIGRAGAPLDGLAASVWKAEPAEQPAKEPVQLHTEAHARTQHSCTSDPPILSAWEISGVFIQAIEVEPSFPFWVGQETKASKPWVCLPGSVVPPAALSQ